MTLELKRKSEKEVLKHEAYSTHWNSAKWREELYQQRALKTQQNAHKKTLKMNFPETVVQKTLIDASTS